MGSYQGLCWNPYDYTSKNPLLSTWSHLLRVPQPPQTASQMRTKYSKHELVGDTTHRPVTELFLVYWVIVTQTSLRDSCCDSMWSVTAQWLYNDLKECPSTILCLRRPQVTDGPLYRRSSSWSFLFLVEAEASLCTCEHFINGTFT